MCGVLVFANAAHRDAGTFNVFFCLPMFLVGMGMGGVMLTFVLTCTLSAHYVAHVAWVGYGGGWGDVNVRIIARFLHTTSITLLGLGMGVGGVMLTFVLTCTLSAHYVDHVAWVGYGGGWDDVSVRINLHAFGTLRRSRCLGWVWGGWRDVNVRINLYAFRTPTSGME